MLLAIQKGTCAGWAVYERHAHRSDGLIMNVTDNSYIILYHLQTNQWSDIDLQQSKLHKFCIPQTNSPETIMWW